MDACCSNRMGFVFYLFILYGEEGPVVVLVLGCICRYFLLGPGGSQAVLEGQEAGGGDSLLEVGGVEEGGGGGSLGLDEEG